MEAAAALGPARVRLSRAPSLGFGGTGTRWFLSDALSQLPSVEVFVFTSSSQSLSARRGGWKGNCVAVLDLPRVHIWYMQPEAGTGVVPRLCTDGGGLRGSILAREEAVPFSSRNYRFAELQSSGMG